MSYEVLARKWRPQQFDDVVGQDHVTRTLKNAIKSGRIAHAYLFVGPRGVGKTSLARILAKALNCAKGPTLTPCDQCDVCREVAAGTSFDVLEIDGASNTGVDQVRDLRDAIQFRPTRGRYKVYIIDEVHMLSTAAFNALLKTLEEPPDYAKFIFATTEPEKVLPTILSRCQRFDLRRIPAPLILERLRLVVRTEKMNVDDEALLAIARIAEGGMRDAESALDQLVSFQGARIQESDVLSVFGLVARAVLDDLAAKILAGDVRGVVTCVSDLDEAGKDLQRVLFDILGRFRDLLVYVSVDDPGAVLGLTDAQVASLKRLASLTDPERVVRVIEILMDVEDRIRYALSRRTLVETALIRAARAATVVSIEEILAKINALKDQMAGAAPAVSAAVAVSVERSDPVVPGRTADVDLSASPAPDAALADRSAAVPAPAPQGQSDGEAARLQARWSEIAAKVSNQAIEVRALLRDARPVKVQGGVVTIAVDPEFASEIERFGVPRNRKAVEHALRDVLGREVRIDVVVGTEPVVAQGVAPGGAPSVPPAGAPAEPAPARAGGARRRGPDLAGEASVLKTMEAFDGTITEIRA